MRGEGFSLLVDELQGKPGDGFRLTLAPSTRPSRRCARRCTAAEVGKGTNIIQLSYQNTDPAMARDVVNTLAQVYLERSVVLKTQEASRSVEFIGEQLEKVRGTLDAAEKELEDFKTRSGVIRLDSEAQALIGQLADADKERAARLRLQRQAEFAAEVPAARPRPAAKAMPPPCCWTSRWSPPWRRSWPSWRCEKRGLLVELSNGHPAVQALQDRIGELQRKLMENYGTILAGLRETDRNLSENSPVTKSS